MLGNIKNRNSISVDVTDDAFVSAEIDASAICRQFGSCFLPFDIAG
jgi:hypothetical protein